MVSKCTFYLKREKKKQESTQPPPALPSRHWPTPCPALPSRGGCRAPAHRASTCSRSAAYAVRPQSIGSLSRPSCPSGRLAASLLDSLGCTQRMLAQKDQPRGTYLVSLRDLPGRQVTLLVSNKSSCLFRLLHQASSPNCQNFCIFEKNWHASIFFPL